MSAIFNFGLGHNAKFATTDGSLRHPPLHISLSASDLHWIEVLLHSGLHSTNHVKFQPRVSKPFLQEPRSKFQLGFF
jgi:hypothetical protein